MDYDPLKHHRRSIRLKEFDYTQPASYFITICTYKRELLFGHINDCKMTLNVAGKIAESCWREIPEHFPHADLDAYIVMPNHVHGIIRIKETNVGVRHAGARHAVPLQNRQNFEQFGNPVPGSIPTIIRSFKSAVTKGINQIRHSKGSPVWQRNYYEHIIRNENEMNRIREYIIDNPKRWTDDIHFI